MKMKIMKSNPHLFEDCGFRHFQFVRSLNHPQMDHSMKHCQKCTRKILLLFEFPFFFRKKIKRRYNKKKKEKRKKGK